MCKWLGLVIIGSFLLTGCTAVEVYTFKKERVDQTVQGNRGYLKGQPPAESATPRNTERTLISVDIGVETYGADKDEECGMVAKTVPQTQSQVVVQKQAPVTKVVEAEKVEEYIK
ncbi:MAG: hypothetical protein PHW46_03605 [Candidatus Omnitrophica bacterium]|nr:hypothetical protein [Candidatus Omnitrophota bacterium]